MDDDFNTAQSMGYFFDLQTYLNSLLNLSKGRPTEEILSLLKKGSEYFSKMGWIFGLFREDPESYLNEQKKAGLKKLTVSEEEILKLIEDRNAARKDKNWKRCRRNPKRTLEQRDRFGGHPFRNKLEVEVIPPAKSHFLSFFAYPFEHEPFMIHCAISQVEVNQVLIRHSQFGRHGLKVRHRTFIEPDRDRPLQILDVRVFLPLHLQKIVMRSHCVTSSKQLLLFCLPCGPIRCG